MDNQNQIILRKAWSIFKAKLIVFVGKTRERNESLKLVLINLKKETLKESNFDKAENEIANDFLDQIIYTTIDTRSLSITIKKYEDMMK